MSKEKLMNKRKTGRVQNKDKIIEVAINLFSLKGYTEVTMREIAAEVGIKAASIYNHFAGKEAILNEITSIFEKKLAENVYPAFNACEGDGLSEFVQKTSSATENFFTEPLHAKIGNILLNEQFHNDTIRSFLLKELIEKPREAVSAYFEKLMQTGKMKKTDALFAAKVYHSFFIYNFYENALSKGTRALSPRAEFERDEHIRLFIENYSL